MSITRVVYEAEGINNSLSRSAPQGEVIAMLKQQFPALASNGNFEVRGDTLYVTLSSGSKA